MATQPVRFRDEGLTRAIAYNLGLTRGTRAFDPTQLETLDDLQWSGWGIGEHDPSLFRAVEALDGIEACSNLRTLVLQANGVRDTTPVAALTRLEELWLLDNSVTRLDGLAQLTRLKVLHMEGNHGLTDIGGLANLPALAEVNLTHCQIADYTPLLTLPALKRLRVSVTLDDTAALAVLVELRSRGVRVEAAAAVLRHVEDEVARARTIDPNDPLAARLSALGLHQLASMWADAGPMARDAKRQTPLHILLQVPLEELGADPEATLTELVDAMLNAGVNPHVRRVALYQETALVLALRARPPGPLSVVERLANAQRDWAIPYRYGTPLAIAYERAYQGHASDEARAWAKEAIAILQRHDGALVPGSAFGFLCRYADMPVIERALALGADPRGDNCEALPLTMAVLGDRHDVVKLLVKKGASPHDWNHSAGLRTAVHRATSVAMLDTLEELGADLTIRDGFGRDALHYVVESSYRFKDNLIAVTDRLLEAGCSLPDALHALLLSRMNSTGSKVLEALLDHWIAKHGVTVDLNAIVENTTLFDQGGRSPQKTAFAKRFRDPFELKAAKTVTHLKQLDKKRTGKKAVFVVGSLAWLATRKLLRTSHIKGSPVDDAWRAAVDAQLSPLVEASDDPILARVAALPACDTTRLITMLWLEGSDAADGLGRTALHHAVGQGSEWSQSGHAKIWQGIAPETRAALATAMLDAGAAPYQFDYTGHTPLSAGLYLHGVLRDGCDVELLKRLTHPTIVNNPFNKPPLAWLWWSIETKDTPELAERRLASAWALIEAGAAWTHPNLFTELCRYAPIELIRAALDAGAPVNTPSTDRAVALCEAVRRNRPDVVKLLLERGADPLHRVETHDGWSLGASGVTVETARLLLEYGDSVRLHSTRLDGKTAAHFAAERFKSDFKPEQALELLNLYLDSGADFGAVDARERSVLDILKEAAKARPDDEELRALIRRAS